MNCVLLLYDLFEKLIFQIFLFLYLKRQILLENKGIVISGEELFHRIWKDEYYTKSNNTITVHIRRLREKLGDTLENPKYIKTIWGVGYKIEEK